MFGTSKALLVAAAGFLVGTLASPATARAQEPTTVTGCLAKGAAEGSFSITGEDGKAYSLTSTTVSLAGHVGHKVSVTGTPAGMETGMAEDAGAKDTGMTKDAGMAKDTGMKHDDMKHDDMKHDDTKKDDAAGGPALNVTEMKMVSAECS